MLRRPNDFEPFENRFELVAVPDAEFLARSAEESTVPVPPGLEGSLIFPLFPGELLVDRAQRTDAKLNRSEDDSRLA